MREFKSATAFAEYLMTQAEKVPEAEHKGLETAGKLLVTEARGYLGEYQESVGAFPEWAPLADSTVAEKEKLGYSPGDNPLVRTHELEFSIDCRVSHHRVDFGSDDPVARWQEFGTPNAAHPIPPRPFISRAAFVKGLEAAEAACKPIVNLIMGKRP